MKDSRFPKLVLLINGAVPLALLGWDALWHQLGADPVNFAIRTTGMLALVFLVLSLAVTPVRRVSGWNGLIHFRRLLGLYAFFYAGIHFLIFFGFDRGLSLSSTLSEIGKRIYLLVGIVGLLAMVPLAVTSTNRMIQRLGAKRWKALHRLAYLAGIAGVVHYYMLVKADHSQPLAFMVVLGLLLAFRYVALFFDAAPAVPAARTAPVASAFPVKMPTAARPKYWSGALRVARVFQETPDVRTFRLVPVDGERLPFRHLPGQYLNLSLNVDGKKINRSYTIASSPTRDAYCEVTIKRERSGVASAYLHETAMAGGTLAVSAPAGKFTFTGTEADRLLLIGGGVGITPLMAIIRSLTDRAWGGDIQLVYSAKTEKDVIFRDELDYLKQRFPNLHVCVTLTQATGTTWAGPTGRIDAELLSRTVPDVARRHVYVCGPTAMMEPTLNLLRGLGVAESQIKTEAFAYTVGSGAPQIIDGPESAGSADATTAATAGPAAGAAAEIAPPPTDATDVTDATTDASRITFARSAKMVDVSPDRTLLEAAEDAGVAIDFECRAGICGTCKVKLRAGHVTMDVQDALTAADRKGGIILACQARPDGPVTIEA